MICDVCACVTRGLCVCVSLRVYVQEGHFQQGSEMDQDGQRQYETQEAEADAVQHEKQDNDHLQGTARQHCVYAYVHVCVCVVSMSMSVCVCVMRTYTENLQGGTAHAAQARSGR